MEIIYTSVKLKLNCQIKKSIKKNCEVATDFITIEYYKSLLQRISDLII